MQGKLIIFSAPSGAGKTTIVHHVLKKFSDQLEFSISACTRTMRPNEVNGKDYHFMSTEDFKQRIKKNEFVEWEEVYQGAFYGTLKSEIQRIWDSGKHVVFDVDVNGGLNLKKYYKERALAIFVKCPSMEVLEQRLRARKTDSEESISTRLFKVKFEMGFENKFDVTLVNNDLLEVLVKAQQMVDDFISK